MTDQQNTFPQIDVPWIFSRLLDHIRASNGQSQQGLFRIKARPEDVLTLRNRYERTPNFQFDPSLSPHVPATLLKVLGLLLLFQSDIYFSYCEL